MAEPTENYYDILEVSPHASMEVLRAAYKSLMQRHHPDKHAADSRMAQRAAQIAQAYAVLSDRAQRTAYDAQLARQQAPRPAPHIATPIYTRRQPAPRSNWYFWMLGTVILGSGLAMWQLSGKRPALRPDASPAQASASQAQKPDSPPAAASAPAKTESPAPGPLRVALLNNDLRVVLVGGEPLPDNVETSRHALTIPALTVDIGPVEAERFANALAQHKEAVLAKLADRLAYASYAELKIDGDLYLARFTLDALREITGTSGLLDDKPAAGTSSSSVASSSADAPRYGIVGVSLPASFGLR